MKGNGDFSIGQEVWPGLGKLVEEMGELNQVLGKLIGAEGADVHFDGSILRLRLIEELGDVHAAILFFTEKNNLNPRKIVERSQHKIHLFGEWHENGLKKRHEEFLAEQTAKEFPYG